MTGRPTVLQAVAAALLAALLITAPARAALFDDEEARKRIEATNQRLVQVQRQLDERIVAIESQMKSQALVDLFNQIELLKTDVARLRGQIEVLSYELTEAQKRQRDLYVDLDSRLRRIESAPVPPVASAVVSGQGVPASVAAAPLAPGPPVAPPAAAFGPPSTASSPGAAPIVVMPGRSVPVPVAGEIASEQRAYDAALDLFRSGNYGAAIAGFAAFVKTYPRSPLAPSAQYWLGNAQFAQKDFRGAIASQRQLLAAYPDSQKVPDALLNIATSQFELGDGAASRRTLEDLIARYPQSDAATKARQRLAIR